MGGSAGGVVVVGAGEGIVSVSLFKILFILGFGGEVVETSAISGMEGCLSRFECFSKYSSKLKGGHLFTNGLHHPVRIVLL